MLSKRWLTVLIFTNVLSIIISVSICLAYVHFVVLKNEKDKYLEFFEKDGQIFVGVCVPNSSLTDDEEKNIRCANAFLINKKGSEWKYVRKEVRPFGYDYQVFIFEALSETETLTLE